MIYSDFNSIVGVDVSPASLEKAKMKHPELEVICADAAHLQGIKTDLFDVYISLRTYQSTLFDVEQSILEAARVLKPNGIFLVSLSDAHREGFEVVRGILVGEGQTVDRNHPYRLGERIRRSLVSLGFTDIGIRTGVFEVYVFGVRTTNQQTQKVGATNG